MLTEKTKEKALQEYTLLYVKILHCHPFIFLCLGTKFMSKNFVLKIRFPRGPLSAVGLIYKLVAIVFENIQEI